MREKKNLNQLKQGDLFLYKEDLLFYPNAPPGIEPVEIWGLVKKIEAHTRIRKLKDGYIIVKDIWYYNLHRNRETRLTVSIQENIEFYKIKINDSACNDFFIKSPIKRYLTNSFDYVRKWAKDNIYELN